MPYSSTVAMEGLLLEKVTFWLVAVRGYTSQKTCTEESTGRAISSWVKTILVTGWSTVTRAVAYTWGKSALWQVTVHLPGATGVTRPDWFTVATLSSEEDQMTALSLVFWGRTVARSTL